ncbi:MAG: tRNA (adenosine(37)-N6)-threonylcarbamoyltransferase complex ATPase subunit type 1 TsaE [Patescibacteria group bacterium]|nr:tRNA (adenosine(37)-N6)-threonylcarbamoyltransferase complex ATPase subunit type 1 TsaE [Patescibacteria group bacterium]MCL5093667.1 tRNA (adenosine(37)-N6)-threonylcarbamoyltransferase complex ATPase subunit type 1 TsaE [Patescibacteria group bacterium]
MNFITKSSEETIRLGLKIGENLEPGMVVALEGDLGGGKTTFAKGLAIGLGIKDNILSPSFTLEKVYHCNRKIKNFYHFDFYRIDNPLDQVGFELEEALADKEGIVVIEWAEKIERELPVEKLIVRFRFISESEREIEFQGSGDKYNKLITNLKITND